MRRGADRDLARTAAPGFPGARQIGTNNLRRHDISGLIGIVSALKGRVPGAGRSSGNGGMIMIQRDSALLSRRVLLAGLGVGAVGAATPALGLGLPAGAASGRDASWWDRTFVSLQAAGLDAWEGVVGETFALKSPNGSHLVRVAAVTPFPRSGPRPSRLARSHAFSVAFEPVAGPALPAADRVYQLVHASYPPLPVYMGAPVEVGRSTRLIAVFN